MRQKALALLTTGAIVLASASPAFAGGKHHKNFKKHNNRQLSAISQNISISQYNRGEGNNIARVNASINYGGGW